MAKMPMKGKPVAKGAAAPDEKDPKAKGKAKGGFPYFAKGKGK